MAPRDEYLLRAAELNAMAQAEADYADKIEFENLARAYLRLAKNLTPLQPSCFLAA